MTSPLSTSDLPPLRPGPAIVAGAVFGVNLSAALQLASDPAHFSEQAATLTAAGLIVGGLIAVVGLLLARSRWTRWFGAAMVATGLSIVIVLPWSALSWVTLAIGAVAAAGVAGPTLDGWLRRRPAALGPSPDAVVLMLVSATAPIVAGIASWSGGNLGDLVYGAALPLLAWAFGRRWTWGLWGLRLAALPLAVVAALGDPLIGFFCVVAHGGAAAVLAWRKQVRIDLAPLLDTLPGPRIATPREEA